MTERASTPTDHCGTPWLGEAEKLMEARDFFGKIVLVPD